MDDLFAVELSSSRRHEPKDELEIYLSSPPANIDGSVAGPLHWWKVRDTFVDEARIYLSIFIFRTDKQSTQS